MGQSQVTCRDGQRLFGPVLPDCEIARGCRNHVKRHIPFALTTLRLPLGPVAVGCALANAPRIVYLPILVTGTLSDIFDGILARRFGVSTSALRRYDSVTDAIYYLFLLGALWLLCKPVITADILALALLIFSEVAVMLISFIRFRKYPATHSYLAKFYGLCLLAALVALLVFNASSWAVIALAAVAVLTNAEIIAIHLLADSPPVDVRSIFLMRGSNGG